MITVERVRTILDQHLEGSGHFLVTLEVRPGNKVVIEVDNNRAITLQELASLNKAVREELGEEADECELQVSSPGMGRPFKVPQQYTKHTGRLVQVQLADGKVLEGILEAFDAEQLTLRVQHPSKVKGRLPKLDKDVTLIPFTDIKTTKASITFN
jgi:ribosome maturation factor RimP